jgi:hypothetical protein
MKDDNIEARATLNIESRSLVIAFRFLLVRFSLRDLYWDRTTILWIM